VPIKESPISNGTLAAFRKYPKYQGFVGPPVSMEALRRSFCCTDLTTTVYYDRSEQFCGMKDPVEHFPGTNKAKFCVPELYQG